MDSNLFLSEADWRALPEALGDAFNRRLHEDNERAVELMVEWGRENFWTLPGDLRTSENLRGNPWNYRVLKHRLVRFAVSWRMTGSERSLREAMRAVDQLLDREGWTLVWGGSGLRHADLKTADYWYCACFALEALAPALGSERKGGLLALLPEWALPAYLAGWDEFDWWRHAEFNWGASVHGGAGLAALAVRQVAPDLSARVLRRVREGLAFVIDAMPEGGGWIEGLMYQTTTLVHLTDYVAAQHRISGDDLGLAKNRRLQAALDFRLSMLGGDGLPYNFSNISERTIEWRLPHAYWWAARCGRADWAGFEDAHPRGWWDTHGICLDLEALWLRDPGLEGSRYERPQGMNHAREIDWLTWSRGESWLGFRAGENGGNHTNRDLGQVIFGIGTERILCDPGYGASATRQHSCLSIRRDNQTPCARAHLFRAREYAVESGHLL